MTSVLADKRPTPKGQCEKGIEGFLTDVHRGLSESQKCIPCKYLYDARGADLFDRICTLDEYYPTRTETTLLRRHGGEIADFAGINSCLIEFGSGSTHKSEILLNAFRNPSVYVPVDISQQQLAASVDAITRAIPGISVKPVCADFTTPFKLPADVAEMNRMGFFPGSTIGNFTPSETHRFLARVIGILGSRASFVIGVDLEKDERVLNAAYNDADGVTAAFNLNLLARINRELSADFDLNSFSHHATYNTREARIEMYLISQRPQIVTIGSQQFSFDHGERIHTENSHKYSLPRFRAIANAAGWRSTRAWVDDANLFSIHLLQSD